MDGGIDLFVGNTVLLSKGRGLLEGVFQSAARMPAGIVIRLLAWSENHDEDLLIFLELPGPIAQLCRPLFHNSLDVAVGVHRFPVDTLKIDRSFVRQMDETEENRQIVKSIVGLAHNLSINVVAEPLWK